MLCQTHEGKAVWKLPKTTECHATLPPSSEEDVNARTATFYKHNLIQYKSQAWVCKKITKEIQALTWFFNDNHRHRDYHWEEVVSAEECQQMRDWHKCSTGYLSTQGDMWQTNHVIHWAFPGGGANCCYWKKWRVTNCYLYGAYVYKRHGERVMESTAGVVTHCVYERGSCAPKDGTHVLWESNKKEHCEYLQWKELPGKQWAENWLADDGNLALTWTKGFQAKDCQGQSIQVSDQGIPFELGPTTDVQKPSNLEIRQKLMRYHSKRYTCDQCSQY